MHSPRTNAGVFCTPLLGVKVENPDHSPPSAESRPQDSIKEMERKLFGGGGGGGGGGHVHSPRTNARVVLHSTSLSKREESGSHISPSGQSPSRLLSKK